MVLAGETPDVGTAEAATAKRVVDGVVDVDTDPDAADERDAVVVPKQHYY
jgi:hypothetical protein